MSGTLLIVDHKQNLRMLYNHELNEEGYQVLLAANEDEAINILENECPDLVILDGKLLLIGGIKPLAKIKSLCNYTLIVVNDVDHKSCEQLLSSFPVDDCIVKSSDFNQLKSKIRNYLLKNTT